VPELPDLPAGLTARPLRADDMAALADLLAIAEPVDDTGELEDADDLADWFGNDRIDLARDTLVVTAADGGLVAWADAVDLDNHREADQIRLEGRVHPDHRGRGIGRTLLGWQLARARELHAERRPDLPGRYRVEVPAAMQDLERLARRAGMQPVRRHFQMVRPLTDLPLQRSVEGIRIVPFDRERDDEVRRAHNRAFADHFGTAEHDQHAWRSWFTGARAFRPELSRLALADGAVVGHALYYEYEADTRATGIRDAYLGQLGTLPEARGRGVASALIAATLAAAVEQGMDRASLQVDTENTTGALGLYERLGFTVARQETTWAVEVPALADQPA
jgi:mycothiol synthase